MKKIISMILCLVMVLSMIPAVYAAGDNGQITTLEELTTGQYIIICDNGEKLGNLASGWLKPGDVVWNITVTENGVKLQDGNGVYVAPKSGNTNGIIEGQYEWAVTVENGMFVFKGQGSDTTTLAYNTTSKGFRAYKNDTAAKYAHTFAVYKADEYEAEPELENPLVLGKKNSLESDVIYNYIAAEDGRIEFDFSSLMDGEGTILYEYQYDKGDRVAILINDVLVPNLENTRMTLKKGDHITVEIVSLDGAEYTASLTMTAVAAATQLVLGDNAISQKVDYSYIAEQDGTLYTTIKELYYDGTYSSEATLTSSVVFRINGVVVDSFKNEYTVSKGDEITVLLGVSINGSASAVLNLSYDGYYEHEKGSRGNPYALDFIQCPTTLQIPGSTAYWFKLSGFGSDATLTVTGANAYVIISGQRFDAVNGSVTVPAYTNIQIGNAGTTPVTYTLTAAVEEGSANNPAVMEEGENTVQLAAKQNYYYQFVAPSDGTLTFTVYGDNWGYQHTLYAADGVKISGDDTMQYEYKGHAATVTLNLTAGQKVVVKLGTMNSSWQQPGGEIILDMAFESEGGSQPVCKHTNTQIRGAKDATCTEEGYTGDTYCADCGELIKKGNTIAENGHNFENGSCTECGEADPDYNVQTVLLGDLNMDGKVNSADVNLLYRYVYGDETLKAFTAEQMAAADANQDGNVNSADVSVLYRYAYGDTTLTWEPKDITL